MKNITVPASWQTRLAIVNDFKLTNSQAIELFNTTEKELLTARNLVDKGVIQVQALTSDEREQWSSQLGATTINTPYLPVASTVAVVKPTTATNTKRGRQGTKITNAFKALSSTPQPIDTFVKEYGVSRTILRQSKRFLDTPVKVSIKRDKQTGQEMICRVE